MRIFIILLVLSSCSVERPLYDENLFKRELNEAVSEFGDTLFHNVDR